MKNQIMLTYIVLTTFFLHGCRDKDEIPPKRFFLNVPFEITSEQSGYLIDVFYDSLSNDTIRNRIDIELQSIEDLRETGFGCMTSTGGHARITSLLTFNDTLSQKCNTVMPGCVGNNEWDTINTFAPRCTIDIYKLHLFKLEPHDAISDKLEDYIVKYVFIRLK